MFLEIVFGIEQARYLLLDLQTFSVARGKPVADPLLLYELLRSVQASLGRGC